MSPPTRIGILDSGVGGLSVLVEIRRLLPEAELVYLADSAHCPYGPKPAETIRGRVRELVAELLRRDCGLVVIACNSATIAAVEALRATEPVAIVGMEPAVKPAVALTRNGVIGVLATEASLGGEKYHRLVHSHGGAVRIFTRAAPEFVELVEAGTLDGPQVEAAVERHVEPLLTQDADVLVLGCTHYPFLRPAIERRSGPGVRVIDSGLPVARQVCRQLGLDPERCARATPAGGGMDGLRRGRVELATSGDPAALERLWPRLCPGLKADAVESILR